MSAAYSPVALDINWASVYSGKVVSSTICWICGSAHAPGEPCSEGEGVDSRLGTVLDGKYTIVRELGRGGMGKVYEAQHLRIGRRVAIKFLLPEYASHPDVIRRFENEARAAGSLAHENIAAVHDFGRSEDGACFLVMDLLTGEDCEKLLERDRYLPAVRVANIVIQVCRGLDAAHRADIVHRDLKPANLFLVKRADHTEAVKILDFGIAKLRSAEDQSATATGQAMGTPYYMSPEQARGDKNVDQRTDVYALGVILYEMLSGKRPHEGGTYLEIIYSILHKVPEPVESQCAGLPPGLGNVIRKAMSADLPERYASAADLGEALIPFAGSNVASFRSRPFAVANAKVGDLTMASERTNPNQTASTMAPVTPKTPLGTRVGQSHPRKKWVLPLAAIVALVAAMTLRIASSSHEPLTPTQSAASSLENVPAAQPTFATAAQAPASASLALSGHHERPDAGAPIALVPPSAAVPMAIGAPVKAARGSATSAFAPQKPQAAVKAAPLPGSAAPPPTPVPNSRTIDISREPNF